MPIAWYLPLVLAALVLAAALPVVLLGYAGASDNTSRLLRDRVELVLDVVVDRVAAHMDPVRDQLGYVADAVRRGALDARDAPATDTYLAGAVAGTPQVTALAFARPDGSVQVRNRADHRSFEERIEALSAVRRSLADARPDSGPSWVGPFWSGTETREVTVMFTDLESYSDFSASRPAAEVVSYLNDLLARVGPIIEASGGTIDKYIGDSVMAFWGAPEGRADHARTACLAACAIAREVESFNAARRSAGQHACRMRVGLHTGPVAVGNVGFSGRVDYTIIGRVVNVAQRFEHCGREVDDGGEVVILASSKTAADAGDDLSWASCPDIEVAGAGVALRCLPTVAPLEEGRASSFSPRGS